MAIVVLDDICSMTCEYCFYWSHLSKIRNELIKQGKINKDEVYFNKEKFQKVIQKLNDSNFNVSLWWKSIVITWWEPTLHPEFIEMMSELIKQWFVIHLLSNFSFQPNWKISKFLKQNINKFRFLVNLNEVDKQPLSKNTIQNLIDLDDDKIKISINLYHTNYNWSYLFDVLKNTKNIHVIRLWLPNPEVSEWIAKGIMKEFLEKYWNEFDKDKYERDLFNEDLEKIEKEDKFIEYWQKDPVVKKYYEELSTEIEKLIDFIENELPEKRKEKIQFYLDCWFDLSLFSDKVYWYLFKRLYYKNTCSIPNMDVNLQWQIKQCYTISNFWDFENKLNIDNVSFNKAKWVYKISSLFFTKWLLRNEDEEQACTAYHLRMYYQLFWDLSSFKDNKLKIWVDPTKEIKNKLKDFNFVTKTYLEKYKQTKNIKFLIRLLQFIEFNFTVHNFDQISKNILKILMTVKHDYEQYFFRLEYYKLISDFIKEQKKMKEQWKFDKIQLKEKYLNKLNTVRNKFNKIVKTLPKKHIKDLDFITEQLISSFELLN